MAAPARVESAVAAVVVVVPVRGGRAETTDPGGCNTLALVFATAVGVFC